MNEMKCGPTIIVLQTNIRYAKKSPGWENFGDDVSSLLPYVYTVFESAPRCEPSMLVPAHKSMDQR
jgi:hypothetical protein